MMGGTSEQSTLLRSHLPSPALLPSSPPSLCALFPLMPQQLPALPSPHFRDPALLLTAPRFHSWRKIKKEGTASVGQEDASWHSPTGSPPGHTRRTCGLQSAVVPSIPAALSGHRAWAPTASWNVAIPRASLLLPLIGKVGPHAH